MNRGLAHRLSAEWYDTLGAPATWGTTMPSGATRELVLRATSPRCWEILAGRRRFTFPQGRARIATAREPLGQNINDNPMSTLSIGGQMNVRSPADGQ